MSQIRWTCVICARWRVRTWSISELICPSFTCRWSGTSQRCPPLGEHNFQSKYCVKTILMSCRHICRNEKFYTCCDEPYLDITFNITMRRKTLFYTVRLQLHHNFLEGCKPIIPCDFLLLQYIQLQCIMFMRLYNMNKIVNGVLYYSPPLYIQSYFQFNSIPNQLNAN